VVHDAGGPEVRRRLLAGAAVLVAAGGAAGVVAVASGDDASGRLEWVEPPLVFTPDGATDARILTGELRNDTGEQVELRVDRLVVRAADGTEQDGNGRFVQAFGHGLYGPGGPPAPLMASRYDQARLGERVTVEPGGTRAVTVAWRAGKSPAQELVLGGLTLTVPAAGQR